MKKSKKILSLLMVMIVAIGLFVSCGNSNVTMMDREGNEFTLPENVEKIISTAPSNTEILVGLGLADKLVAVDQYSEGLEGVSEALPKLDLVNPDLETILELDPDIIVASGQNVVGDNDPFALIKEAGIVVVYIPNSSSIEEIYNDIEFIATVTGTKDIGEEIVDSMKKEVEKVAAIGKKITDKKKVYFEIGSIPSLYSFGGDTFLNEMIEIIGAENIFAEEEAWITANPEAIIAANPDVILTNELEFNGVNIVDEIKKRDGWDSIKAIQDGAVYRIDTDSSSRPTQNIIKALKEMAEAIYPNEYK